MSSGSGFGKAGSSQEYESSELAQFRAEWKRELESRKRVHHTGPQGAPSATTNSLGDSGSTTSPGPSTSTGSKQTGFAFTYSATRPHQPSKVAHTGELHPAITPDGRVVEQRRANALTNALSVYKQAVQHEQDGELDEALTLYRQAFRMDAHVDRAYRREEMLVNIATQQAGKKPPAPFTIANTMPTITPVTQPLVAEGVNDVITSIQALSVKPQVLKTSQAIITGTLGTLVATFFEQEPTLTFKPEDEIQPVAVDMLPEELLVEIIHMLDPSSIEIFARVCKKARLLTLESSIWRNLVLSTYREPQIPDMETLAEIITSHMFDYRRVFIEQPRVRMDGVYIAICHYVRPGQSENHWVNISHLITYHRYLRFYPNGQVLSLLANEEHSPQTIINMLKPSLRMKGLYIGTWTLTGTEIALSNLFDASGRYPIPGLDEEPLLISHPPASHHHHHHHHHHHSQTSVEAQASRYVFVMSLGLKSRPLGRWNRLDMHSYDTLNLETGDLTPVALKHERPFWFSKVRSFA
ncbi:hypothetical protein D9756_002334 [Leucocoprinus leucothites]|uniref:F-box only protein 9 n=1 Tax=Leucocoprinus leucothites TaxID=201217 RepID=A0A8H5LLN6_9AGAR|nr:hypothetical protein D9756_002334 [Leucoagaricus leucothites]